MTVEQPTAGRAVAATRVLFLLTGLLAASWAGRVPAVQERLGLSPGGLAVAVLAVEGGALLGLPLGSALVTRRGSRAGAALGLAGYAPLLSVAAAAPSLPWLAAALAGWAAANSVVDVALNAQGVALERRCRRPVLSGLHAAQGVGLLAGALGATAAAAADVPLGVHLGAATAAGLVAGGPATRLLLREPPAPARPRSAGSRRGLLGLGAVASCAFLVDASATQWVAVHLRADHGAGPGLAAAGLLAVTAALVVGRLPGDRLLLRCRRAAVVRGCGLAVAAGAGLAALAPTAGWALAGWALVGLAVAPLAPVVLGAAPDAPHRGGAGIPAPAAIATVTTVGYLGSATGPPAVGVLAEGVGLSAALVLVVLAGLAAAVLAGTVPARR
ncbi:MFS transporter [Geodermatophilus sp. SYSU D00698]